MSINSMANAAAARRADLVPLNRVPATVEEIARASRTTPVAAPQAAPEVLAVPAPGEPPMPDTPPPAGAATVDTAMNVLFGYIPTEVLTLYVSVTAALQRPTSDAAGLAAFWVAFWVFLAATPLVVWLVFAAKVKAAGKPLPASFGAWPIWEMLAATLAYLAWAFGLPLSPFSQFWWYSAALSGLAVIGVSTVLGLLAPLFQRPLST